MASKMMMGIISLTAAFTLAACGENTNEDVKGTSEHTMHQNEQAENSGKMDHSTMNHSTDGHIPEGLKESTNPKYPIASSAVIQADHMEGMNGAEATIVGAFDTTVYTVSYTPINGGDPISNHKWVIHEELEGVGNEPLKPGDTVKINADHMEGMNGATATIDSAEKTTVYMVDYTSTTGEKVKNHKWVTESELSSE